MFRYSAVVLMFFIGITKCRVLKELNVAETSCSTKEDGLHETRDVFRYIICKNKQIDYGSCEEDLFDPCTKKCVAPSELSRDNFCRCQENGNYMDPWNCHKYITCFNGHTFMFNCVQLVYDPLVDRCVQPGKTECKQVHVAAQEIDLRRRGSWVSCKDCFGHSSHSKRDPRCRYGCDKWMTFPPTKTTTVFPPTDPTIEPDLPLVHDPTIISDS